MSAAAAAGRVARRATASVTPGGRAVLAVAVAGLVAGRLTGLAELWLIGLVAGLLLVLAVPWLLLPMRVVARLQLRPPRAVAGETVDATVRATNEGALPVLHPLVRLPAIDAEEWLRLPTLRPGATHGASLRLATPRRGVHRIGPAGGRRTDPLGLLARDVAWSEPLDLHVRPVIVHVPTLGTGLVRDLEGVATDRMSLSDLAFHALREYHPGDDLRHVHWRSSARAGELLVRQYHESRRSHAALVLDARPSAYSSPDVFETVVSAAASLVVCAAREEHLLTLTSARERVSGLPAQDVLDACCRVALDPGAPEPGAAVADALGLAPDASLLVVLTGDRAELDPVVAALAAAPVDARALVVRVLPGGPAELTLHAGREVVTLGGLGDLAGLMAATG